MKAIKNYKFGVLAVLSFLALAIAAPQAQAKNTLRCTVVDEAGNPLDKQEILVTLIQTGKEWKRKTNKNGEVQFKGLNDGTYQIEGHELQDYFAKSSDPVDLSGNVTHPCNLTFVSVNYLNQLLQSGVQAVQQNNFDLAIEKGKEAVNWNPDMAPGYYVLSIGYAGQGNATEAVAEINKAAEIDPENFQNMVVPIHLGALGAQADSALTKRDFDGAIAKYEEMVSVSPEEGNSYYGMALAYGHKGDYQKALEIIGKAIELKPAEAQYRKIQMTLQEQYLESMNDKLELK